jgi:2-methylcitrate dehydratase PrpD
LLKVMQDHQLTPADIATVVTRVHQGAIDVLGPVTDPQTVHQSKFSMGTVLALAAHFGFAGLDEFEAHFKDPDTVSFRDRVSMELDDEVDAAYPARWIGKVSVTTKDGRQFDGRVDDPKGDPGNTLNRPELEQKMHRLSEYGDRIDQAATDRLLTRLWAMANAARVQRLVPLEDL